ncbi:retinoid-inducible serine carboxypeptidase-like isoform X2 [Tribolium madens]|uniref:retinoid-inducible serine carboxypeptidase-like isoform X2 n=1 Tax=Tribolium madens TaxID=41895 RepID=UPI001CF74D0E|nr:retinoid-inducible serine carboxypeptidase-like isoform X2 [Tribolium madens]
MPYEGRQGVGGSDQDWGYITVRPNAHMFWWLYYTTYNNVSSYTDRPLIIWLQGGPGMPASGFGNFLEIGPLDSNFNSRKGSFIENFNVLFIDNPVGVGFSYISDNETKMVTNGDETAEDLYNFLKIFLKETHPEFRKVPIYVFGESYGGKMATEFVYKLTQKEKTENLTLCNLKALALGDAFISPISYINNYAPMAFYLGLVNKRVSTRIDELTKQIQVLINKKEYVKASDVDDNIMIELDRILNVDFYNIVRKINSTWMTDFQEIMNMLEYVMNSKVKNKLNITEDVYWEYNSDIYNSLKGDILKSVTDKIETILNTTDIKVLVYNGMLDFIVNTAGTVTWLDNLMWTGKEKWSTQNETVFEMYDIIEGYSKKVDNLVFYVIFRAGHSVPADNLPVLNEILRREILVEL